MDLGYVILDSQQFREAEDYTQREQDLRETGVVPGSLRNISQEARERHAAFWKWVEARQQKPQRRLRLVNER